MCKYVYVCVVLNCVVLCCVVLWLVKCVEDSFHSTVAVVGRNDGTVQVRRIRGVRTEDKHSIQLGSHFRSV